MVDESVCIRNSILRTFKDVKPSNGNVCGFIVLNGSPEELKMNGANIHSFVDLPK